MNVWTTLGVNLIIFILFWLVVFIIPHKIKVAGIPHGFNEKQCAINDVTLNYVEGPKNGPPFLLIPGQMESWQGYKAVMPELSKKIPRVLGRPARSRKIHAHAGTLFL